LAARHVNPRARVSQKRSLQRGGGQTIDFPLVKRELSGHCMAHVKILTIDGERTVELKALTSVGRLPSNSVVVRGNAVSKEHCTIEHRPQGFFLKDLQSRNGTFLNGARVTTEVLLKNRDEIILGQSDVKILVEDTSLAQSSGPRLKSLMAEDAHVELQDAPHAIGTEIPLNLEGFLPYHRVASNEAQLSMDYERLRICYELSRSIAVERDTGRLLASILDNLRRIVRAERGAILIRQPDGSLTVGASQRSDGNAGHIRVSLSIVRQAMDTRVTLLTEDAVQELLLHGGGNTSDSDSSVMALMKNNVRSAMVVPLLHDDTVLGAIWLDSSTESQFTRWDVDLVSGIASQASMFIHMNILARKVEEELIARERLSRLLSPNIAEEVASGRLEVKKGGQLISHGTIFNSDIRGFTRMSESTGPQMLVDMLNDYFERMVEVVFRHEGTLDKFMGDGLMALWGAPVWYEDGDVRSVECALDMLDALRSFNADRVGQPALRIGIGIHTGPMVAGYVGSSKTLSYTAIGDSVNTSARLCGIAAEDQILVSEPTLARLDNRYRFDELPPASLKGKEKPLRIFAIRGRR